MEVRSNRLGVVGGVHKLGLHVVVLYMQGRVSRTNPRCYTFAVHLCQRQRAWAPGAPDRPAEPLAPEQPRQLRYV